MKKPYSFITIMESTEQVPRKILEDLCKKKNLSVDTFSPTAGLTIDSPLSAHVAWAFNHIYAVPYPDAPKQNGVARLHHGIHHTSRAALYVPMFANLWRAFDNETANKLTLEDLKLIQIAVLFHDAGRENEGVDLWDEDSACLLYFYLVYVLQLDDRRAKSIACAAAQKDSPLEKTIQQQLIHDADCLDIIRVNLGFDFKYLDFYKAVATQNKDALKILKQLIQEARGLILEQGDFATYFRPEIKIHFEQPEVWDLMTATVISGRWPGMTYLYSNGGFLSDGIQLLDFPQTDTQEITEADYIHATNSLALPVLEKTNMTLLPIIPLIRDYGVAPLGGEITGGGFSSPKSEGTTAFARLFCHHRPNHFSDEYHLEMLINNYTRQGVYAPRYFEQNPLKSRFESINVLLIEVTKLRQMGKTDHFSNIDIVNMEEYLNAVEQAFYLLLLLGRYIFPDKEKIIKLKAHNKHYIIMISEALSFESFVDKIHKERLDIKAIAEAPTSENLKKIESLFELPEEITYCDFQNNLITRKPSERQLFSQKMNTHITHFYGTEINKTLFDETLGKIVDISIDYALPNLNSDMIAEYMAPIKNRFSILKSIVENSKGGPRIDMTLPYVKRPFPLIFICDQFQEHFSIIDSSSQEYRAKQPLKIGQDVKAVATDTVQHQRFLKEYFEKQGVTVRVVLFKDLYAIKAEGAWTSRRYEKALPPQGKDGAQSSVPSSIVTKLSKSPEIPELMQIVRQIKEGSYSKPQKEWLLKYAKNQLLNNLRGDTNNEEAIQFLKEHRIQDWHRGFGLFNVGRETTSWKIYQLSQKQKWEDVNKQMETERNKTTIALQKI